MAPSSSASRRDRDERAERLQAVRKQQQRAERRRSLVVFGIAGVLVVVIAGAVTFAVLHERANRPSLAAVQSYPNEDRTHVTGPVKYDVSPPVGGPHNPVWLNCGVYDQPVPNENAVHDLEHGAVWVTYRPDLPKADVTTLVQSLPDTYVTVSPYPGLPAPVVASAWGVQLRLTGVDDKRLATFVTKYRQGPQTPEPGAACTGGTDGSQQTIDSSQPTTTATRTTPGQTPTASNPATSSPGASSSGSGTASSGSSDG